MAAEPGEAPVDDESTLDDPSTTLVPDPAPGHSRARSGWQAMTTRGRVTVLVAVLATALGLATGWREWIGIAAALGVLLLIAVVSAIGRSSCAVELDLRRTRFVVGEPGVASLVVRNTANRRMLPLRMELEIGTVGPGSPAGPATSAGPSGTAGGVGAAGPASQAAIGAVTVPVPSLRAGASHLVGIPLPTRHRAVVELGPLRAVRGDLLGLIRRVVQWPVQERVFVHPRTARPGSSLPGFVRDLEGEESTLRTASDLSFHTLREYVPGDDRRFIHWKSSARSGILQVREFLQTHRSLIGVVLAGSRDDYCWAEPADDDAGADEEFEVAVSCAASLVTDLVRQRREVVTDAAGTPIRGVTVDGVLDQFSAVGAAVAAPDLIFQIRRLVRRNPRVSLLVLVFGSTVQAAQIRAAVRSCPSGASVLAVRARVESSPEPDRVSSSEAYGVLTVSTVAALPAALRIAG